MMDKPEHFAVFCKDCGTYDVDLFVNMDEEIEFECQNEKCGTKEKF
jgi:hypothetical protein